MVLPCRTIQWNNLRVWLYTTIRIFDTSLPKCIWKLVVVRKSWNVYTVYIGILYVEVWELVHIEKSSHTQSVIWYMHLTLKVMGQVVHKMIHHTEQFYIGGQMEYIKNILTSNMSFISREICHIDIKTRNSFKLIHLITLKWKKIIIQYYNYYQNNGFEMSVITRDAI